MKSAIAILENSLEALAANEPINRAEGNLGQADLEAANASEVRQAIAVLQSADAAAIPRGVLDHPETEHAFENYGGSDLYAVMATMEDKRDELRSALIRLLAWTDAGLSPVEKREAEKQARATLGYPESDPAEK